jgi:hypothetical protein
VGVKESLGTLPGLVVCGGLSVCRGRGTSGTVTNDVWRLDLATMQWEPMPALVTARSNHACCAVRGRLVVLGGQTAVDGFSSSVEMPSSEQGAFVQLPPLSCGGIRGAVAIPVEESDSASGQVLLLGGEVPNNGGRRFLSTVHLVDLATGACTAALPDLLLRRSEFAAERLPDGRIVCCGGIGANTSGEVYGPPRLRAPNAAWTWRQLLAMGKGVGNAGSMYRLRRMRDERRPLRRPRRLEGFV